MPQLPLAQAPVKVEVDLKANGEVSRMRSHKGNMPSLPQTKYCALCPAKFTRTTHLNRHLRSHTNERAHRCDICTAEFTRSDLLTRHKRTCGDSNANRSRRKSCQACAESKVKCNLQQPCSKCTSRGKECVFINDPEAARNRKMAKRLPLSNAVPESLPSQLHTRSNSVTASSPTSSHSITSHGLDDAPYFIPPSAAAFDGQYTPSGCFGPPGVPAFSDSSSVTSAHSSPREEAIDHHQLPHSMTTGYTSPVMAPDLDFFAGSGSAPVVDERYTTPPCTSPLSAQSHSEGEYAPRWSFDSGNQNCTAYASAGPPVYFQPPPADTMSRQNFASSGPPNLSRNASVSSKASFSSHHFSDIALNVRPLSPLLDPSPDELQHYLRLFTEEYNSQVPLFHRPTCRAEVMHPMLISAMQACGALLAKSEIAMDFIIKTLTSSRESLIVEFSKSSCTMQDHLHLILAVVLFQSIISFQPRPDQRALSRMYHDILIMMIRKTGLIKSIGSWTPPSLTSPHNLEEAWRDWAHYETFKRALLLAFAQDTSYCMYYAAHPAFMPSELELNLPCDDSLWRAQSAREWYHIQRSPSAYGSGVPRILGTSMKMALQTLAQPTSAAIPFNVNPFSSFVLIHAILRDIFDAAHPSGELSCLGPPSTRIGTSTIDCALQNWQRLWQMCPDAPQLEQFQLAVPFVYNPIPFYWLACFAEQAKQNGEIAISRSGEPLARADEEARFRSVKAWLNQINNTLRSGSRVTHSTQWHS